MKDLSALAGSAILYLKLAGLRQSISNCAIVWLSTQYSRCSRTDLLISPIKVEWVGMVLYARIGDGMSIVSLAGSPMRLKTWTWTLYPVGMVVFPDGVCVVIGKRCADVGTSGYG